MEYLPYFILASSTITFVSYTNLQSRVAQNPDQNASPLSDRKVFLTLFFLVCLITPLYFFYLENSILMTIFKTIVIYISSLLASMFIFKKFNQEGISLMAIYSLIVTIILIIIYIIIKNI